MRGPTRAGPVLCGGAALLPPSGRGGELPSVRTRGSVTTGGRCTGGGAGFAAGGSVGALAATRGGAASTGFSTLGAGGGTGVGAIFGGFAGAVAGSVEAAIAGGSAARGTTGVGVGSTRVVVVKTGSCATGFAAFFGSVWTFVEISRGRTGGACVAGAVA